MTVTWTIRWADPFTKPPEGQPEVLFQITRRVSSTSERPPELDEYLTIGTGYGVCVSVEPDRLRRQMKLETKQRIHRQRLKRRVEQKFPLFAQDLIADAIDSNPDYYGDEQDER